LPFPSDAFQTVYLNQVIAHLEPDVAGAVLTEIRRVLRRGGMVFIASPSRANKRRTPDPTYVNLLAPSELRELLLAHGFVGLVALDEPLHKGPIGRRVFARLHWDRLSATATCIAYKPD
jgi:SAM-dependent methyltransferase